MLIIIAAFLLLVFVVNPAEAMVPQIKFPQWNKTKVYISEWLPTENKLTICAEIEPLIPVTDVSCVIEPEEAKKKDFPHEVSLDEGKTYKEVKEAEAVNSGKIIFKRTFLMEPGTETWVQVNMRAKPERVSMIELIREAEKDNPMAQAVLENEIAEMKSPLYIGKLIPLSAREDIAITSVKETSMILDSERKTKLYLWYPEAGLGKGFEAEGLRTFRNAVATRNATNVSKLGNLLIKRLNSSEKPLVITKENGDSFVIPVKTAKQLINANIVTLRSLISGNPKFIEDEIKNSGESDVKIMLKYNLGSLLKSLNKNKEAAKIFSELIKEYPAWPAVKEAY